LWWNEDVAEFYHVYYPQMLREMSFDNGFAQTAFCRILYESGLLITSAPLTSPGSPPGTAVWEVKLITTMIYSLLSSNTTPFHIIDISFVIWWFFRVQ